MYISFGLDLNISATQNKRFEDYCRKTLLSQLYKNLRQIRGSLKTNLQKNLLLLYLSHGEVRDLIEGKLRDVVGLRSNEAAEIANQIGKVVSEDIEVEIKKGIDEIELIVSLVKSDYSDILGLKNATYISINKAGIKTAVPWLSWLLFEGDKIIDIVSGFHIAYKTDYKNKAFKGSRSGGALMFKRGNFRIPPEYSSGHPDVLDTFITRAFNEIELLVALEVTKLLT